MTLPVGVLVVVLALFVLSLALPTLPSDLHASSSDMQWSVDSYSHRPRHGGSGRGGDLADVTTSGGAQSSWISPAILP
ncbi:MAG TPA: hypothetical protein VFQ44_24770 [Streptosporangiaceae bacterium]|nr:hypothetical protein [Streptosporangiaceae bacterium]